MRTAVACACGHLSVTSSRSSWWMAKAQCIIAAAGRTRNFSSLPSAATASLAGSHRSLYGDFQYSIDMKSEDFLRRGVFSCYRPVDPLTPIPEKQRELSEKQWIELLTLAHTGKREAFERYAEYYLSTSGQIYWSDTHQL